MTYRLVAVDVDGTLLNDKREVTPSVRRAIEGAKARGALFTISTGRPVEGIERYLDLIGGDLPVITCNGAILVTAKTRRVIFSSEMSHDAASSIIDRGVGEGAVVAAWSKGVLYSSETGSSYSAFYKSVSGMDTLDISLMPDGNVTKIVWIMPPERIAELQKSYVLPEGVQAKTSDPMFLEFFSSVAGKGKALKILAEYLHVDISETMAIGDNYNDIDMIAAAGLGVAMGNAPDGVKRAADFVTSSNNEDGVARAIEKFT